MRREGALPWQARALDAFAVASLVLSISVLLSGGFREWTPLGRLSVTSAWRPGLAAVVALAVRHWLWSRPAIGGLLWIAINRRLLSAEARAVWPIVVATRVGVLLVGFLGIVLLGYAPNTPPYRIYHNDLLDMPARWDTGWYMGIALSGYEFDPAKATAQQNIAFFPVYPMLMRYGSLFAARQVLWTGVAISFIAFLAALIYFVRLAGMYVEDSAAGAAAALLASYPFALFFSTAYTESLFLLIVVAACYHFERDELWKAGAWGLVAGLTRPNGCLLSIVLALLIVFGRRSAPWREMPFRQLATRIAVASAPGLGMLVYSAYIYSLTGNPIQWAAQNAAWGRVYRSVHVLVGDHVESLQQHGLYEYASYSDPGPPQRCRVAARAGQRLAGVSPYGCAVRGNGRRECRAPAADGRAAVDGAHHVRDLSDLHLARCRRAGRSIASPGWWASPCSRRSARLPSLRGVRCTERLPRECENKMRSQMTQICRSSSVRRLRRLSDGVRREAA